MSAGSPAVADDASVTVVTSRRVRPGKEAEFELWLEGIGQEAAKFPGLIGRRITRPQDHEHPEYVVVFKFDSYSNLRRWTESDVRKTWLAKVEPLALDEYREQVLSGLETWFTLPAKPGLAPPPRYKMALVTWVVIWPLSMGLGWALTPVLGPLPLPIRSLLLSGLMVSLMTWVVMPRTTRLFRRWLYPGS